jgi:uncharacterized protein YcbX
MHQVGTLETIYRYPVKSMAGEELMQAFVGYGGIMGDRVFAFHPQEGDQGLSLAHRTSTGGHGTVPTPFSRSRRYDETYRYRGVLRNGTSQSYFPAS